LLYTNGSLQIEGCFEADGSVIVEVQEHVDREELVFLIDNEDCPLNVSAFNIYSIYGECETYGRAEVRPSKVPGIKKKKKKERLRGSNVLI